MTHIRGKLLRVHQLSTMALAFRRYVRPMNHARCYGISPGQPAAKNRLGAQVRAGDWREGYRHVMPVTKRQMTCSAGPRFDRRESSPKVVWTAIGSH
jgi:hypothetical protein